MMRAGHRQRGLSLILVVFIIVALSVLATALVQILSASYDSVAREVLSARALMAAESGAQRMLNAIHEGDETDCINTSYNFPALSGCGEVTLTCTWVQLPAGTGVFYYNLESTGVCGPAAEQASRTIEVQAKNL